MMAAADIPEAAVDAAGAILQLQAEIQIATCRSCEGHGSQAMVLEPYCDLPCLRCHGEGTVHEVPPGQYSAVLDAALHGLGGASPAKLAELLAPLNAVPETRA